jgi:tellurite resistance protein TehA-like permease
MSCSLASIILILVIISVILDVYIIFHYKLVKNKNISLAATFLMILISIVVVWISNKLCYNYNWILYVIIVLVVLSIADSVIVFSDPLKREKTISEIRMDEEKFIKYII